MVRLNSLPPPDRQRGLPVRSRVPECCVISENPDGKLFSEGAAVFGP